MRKKWPRLDKRKTPHRLDSINFNLLSPLHRKQDARRYQAVTDLERQPVLPPAIHFQTMTIEARAFAGCKLYGMALDKFMGNSVTTPTWQRTRLAMPNFAVSLSLPAGAGQWVGNVQHVCAKSEVDAIIAMPLPVKQSPQSKLEQIWRDLPCPLIRNGMDLVADIMESWYGKPVEAFTADDVPHDYQPLAL